MTQPDPWPNFLKDYRQLKDLVRRLVNRDPLSGTGMSVPGRGTTQVDGSLVVQSGEARSGNYSSGTSGWRLRPDGTIEMNDAQIRGGIIGNDALANPVMPQNVFLETSSSFSLTPAWKTLLSATITVPTGYTKCQIIAMARVYAANTTTSLDDVYGLPVIDGFSPGAFATPCSADGYGYSEGQISRLLTGLSAGGTFTIQCQGSTTSGNWSAHAINAADLSAQLLWMR